METTPSNLPQSETLTNKDVTPTHHKTNLYPQVRHIFLIAATLCALLLIVFLMYQNGKSIYDNGI